MREDALANGPPVARSDAQERLEREAVMNGVRPGALAADGAKVVGCSGNLNHRIEYT